MHEIVNTRHNPMIDPTLHIWGWEIAVYLFLGGIVAGSMIISGYFLFRGRHKDHECSCLRMPLLSIILLSAGMLALFMDLEHKLYVWRMYVTFKPASPMSWGSWILIFVYPALAVNLLVRPPAFLARRFPRLERANGMLANREGVVRAVGIANMFLGAALGIYTGILLSALGARPLWNSAALGILFLVSGLSTASALIHMLTRSRQERELLARTDNALLATELLLLALYIIGLLSASGVHMEAARSIISGPFAPAFWVFVVGLGIMFPLGIQALAVAHRIEHSPVAPLMVLAGGLALRFVIVFAGQASHWTRSALVP